MTLSLFEVVMNFGIARHFSLLTKNPLKTTKSLQNNFIVVVEGIDFCKIDLFFFADLAHWNRPSREEIFVGIQI